MKKFGDNNYALPTWHTVNDDGETVVHYDIPEELADLTLAEKLLIQRLSPIIPLVHLKHGVYGSRGHVCTYPKDIGPICNVLPRLPKDVEIVKVVRTYTGRDGKPKSRGFNVRREKVLRALKWLKKHNPIYQDIEIQASNLNWMEGKLQNVHV
jgi:hypothetical protein